MRRNRQQQGFTLVEVVVATAVLSLLLLATVTALRTLGNTQLALERNTLRVDEIRSVGAFLRDLMESAIVGNEGGGLTLGRGSQDSTYFRLHEDALEWKSTVLFGDAFGGTYIVRVAREGDELVLRWAEPDSRGIDPGQWPEQPHRTLVHDVSEFAVTVRRAFDEDWSGEWQEEGRSPALVRLRLKSAERYWPDLIMRVQR